MDTTAIEEWRPVTIEPFHEFYEVSDLGRIRSTDRECPGRMWPVRGRILKPGDIGNGYLVVNLCADGFHRTKLVHRIVALAFIPNPDGFPEVNHKDLVKANNTIRNLEWSTHAANIAHADAAGVMKVCSRKIFSADIPAIIALRSNGLINREIADIYGVATNTISGITRKHRHGHLP